MNKIGLGGSCHWCTEAIFQSIRGVKLVEQGWISSEQSVEFSEAVLVHFDHEEVSLKNLLELHVHSHSATSNHRMRDKYRSAIYVFNKDQGNSAKKYLKILQEDFTSELITQVLNFKSFRLNDEKYLNYYYSNPDKAFCSTRIRPKLEKLIKKFPNQFIK